MNIIFFTTIYLPHIGGIEFYIHDLAQYAIKQGCNVTIIVADTSCDKKNSYDFERERVIRIPSVKYAEYFLLRDHKQIKLIDNLLDAANIVHLNSCKFLYKFLAKRKKKYNYKLIISSHGWVFHSKEHMWIKNIFFKSVVAKYAKFYDCIINVSYQDEKIANNYGILNTIVILSGTDCTKFANLQPKNSYTGQFTYFGRIARNKGLKECLKKLSEYNEPYEFKIIGDCEDNIYMNELKTLINEKHMQNSVLFLGKLTNDEIRKELEKTDVILMPSLHEGFGLTLVECLLSNRIIIANEIESYKYILKSVCAEDFLFDYNSEKSSLTKKIAELKKHDVKPINVEQFSIEKMASKTFKAYGL
ncbi:MAG: glycosyltransferase family 4 protein [Hungatella sp.]|nr:glycosyltransferase family 4 protein [Hungatella sp.]